MTLALSCLVDMFLRYARWRSQWNTQCPIGRYARRVPYSSTCEFVSLGLQSFPQGAIPSGGVQVPGTSSGVVAGHHKATHRTQC
jgi:hypothetical protein